MRNSKGSLIRPTPLPDSASHPVVTPLSPSVVYASETPDALDDQYEGRVHGYTYSREEDKLLVEPKEAVLKSVDSVGMRTALERIGIVVP